MYFVCAEREKQENSYTKHTFRERLPVTATLGRVNEALQCVWGLNFCMNEMQSAAYSLQKEVSQLLSIKTHIQGSKDLQGG